MLRAVPYTSLWGGVILWALLTGALLIGTGWKLHKDYLFAYDAKPALAVIDRKYYNVSYGRHGKNYTPCLDYHYEAGSTVAHCECSVKEGTYQSVGTGGKMPIIYVVDDPTDNQIELPAEIQTSHLLSVLLVVASLVFALGGALILRYYIKRNQLHHYLLSNGVSCEGTVSTVDFDFVGKYHDIRQYYLIFNFRDNANRERTGRTWYLRRGEELKWQDGNSIVVYYDPADSECFTVAL